MPRNRPLRIGTIWRNKTDGLYNVDVRNRWGKLVCYSHHWPTAEQAKRYAQLFLKHGETVTYEEDCPNASK